MPAVAHLPGHYDRSEGDQQAEPGRHRADGLAHQHREVGGADRVGRCDGQLELAGGVLRMELVHDDALGGERGEQVLDVVRHLDDPGHPVGGAGAGGVQLALLRPAVHRRPGPPLLGREPGQPVEVGMQPQVSDRAADVAAGGDGVIDAEHIEHGRHADAPRGGLGQTVDGYRLDPGHARVIHPRQRHGADAPASQPSGQLPGSHRQCLPVQCLPVHGRIVSPRLSPMTYRAAADRYKGMQYRRCGRSGLQLPVLSLGLWHNFGHDRPYGTQQAICRRAFDLGITHFDLANNYGPPYGAAEENFGRMLATDLRPYRDELVISTKAGYVMWPGPYGEWGSRKYLLASLNQSLRRMGLDYVDIFYSHRLDPDTPLEETMGALDAAVRAGKALYVGISSYSPDKTQEAAQILRELGTPLLIHQPSYSMFNRWIEGGLLDVLEAQGIGCIAFSPLAQGLLTDRYLDGIPADSRVRTGGALSESMLSESNLAKVRALNEVATRRGQSLAQLALVWALRDPRMTSLVLGASSVRQLEQNVAALSNMDLDDAELAEIDRYATEGDINLWARSSAV